MAFLAGLVLLVGLSLAAGDGVAWEKSYAGALAKAKERNVPILVCFNMDREVANEQMVETYRDPEFVGRSADFVCLVASTFRHDQDGAAICPRFGGISCAEHHDVEIKASDALVGKDEVIAPQHVLVGPDGKVLMRRAWALSKDELLKMMKMAEKALKTGAAVADLERAEAAKEADDEGKKIAELIEATKDHNAERRKPAIMELGRIDDLRARDALIELLDPRSMDDTRADALDALASKGNYDALQPVIERLSDTNTTVVRRAIMALRIIALPEAVAPLMKLWKKKNTSLVAGDLPAALVACGPDVPEVAAVVKKACSSSDGNIQQKAICALRHLPPDAATRKILETSLADGSANIRGSAAWVVGTTRERALEAKLASRLEKETSPDVRLCMEAALRNLKAADGTPGDPELDSLLWRFSTGM